MNASRWAAAAASVAIGLAGCSPAGDKAGSHDDHGQAAAPADGARRIAVEAEAMSFTHRDAGMETTVTVTP